MTLKVRFTPMETTNKTSRPFEGHDRYSDGKCIFKMATYLALYLKKPAVLSGFRRVRAFEKKKSFVRLWVN